MRRLTAWAALVIVTMLVSSLPAAAEAPFEDIEEQPGTVGSDGAMWSVASVDPVVLQRRTTDGATSTVQVPEADGLDELAPGIAGDPVWGADDHVVYRIGADGRAETVALPEGRDVSHLAPASDGRAMWFLGGTGGSSWLGMVDPAGEVSVRSIQIPMTGRDELTATPSGALWSSPGEQGVLRRIAADRTVRLVDVEGAVQGAPAVLADGTTWVAVTRDAQHLALQIRPDDSVAAAVELPAAGGHALVGPDGGVWFSTERGYLRLVADGAVQPVLDSARGSDRATTPQTSVAFAGDLWYATGASPGGGRLDLGEKPVPTVRAEVVSDVGVDEGTTVAIEVTGSAGTPSGTVEVVDYQCCHHGYWNHAVLGSASLDADGTARITVEPHLQRIQQSRHFHVDYSGDAAYLGNTSLDVDYEGTPPSDPERYIVQVYEDLLDRFPEDAGLTYWTGQLERGAPRTAVGHALAISEEHGERLVERLFREHLDRDAEAAGRDSFVADLARGATIDQIRASVLGSDEFFRRVGGTVDGYIDALYDQVLARDPDPHGVSYWRSELRQGVSRPTMASALLGSTEALERLVADHFERFLRRDVDGAARIYWAGLLRAGFREERLIAELIGAPEYYGGAILEHF